MGSSKSTASSPGKRKAKTGNDLKIKDQAMLQGKKADNEARKKLGIVETKTAYSAMGGSMGKTTGYESTSGNQMYGAAYNEARGEYLASQGLATAREATDAMGRTRTVYDPKTADGTYTNMTRMSAQEARANKTPLSKEMYSSQRKIKTGVGLATMVMGVPIIPSVLLNNAATPYSDYVNQSQAKGFYNFSTTGKNPIDSIKSVMSEVSGEFADETEAQKKQKKYRANIGQSVSSKERSLFASSPKTFNV
tara:strand:+ start:1282 stop:2031 length:750 start_codon:yes stop_codon:yes gene_type:complete